MENEPQADGTQPKRKGWGWGWVEYLVLFVLIGIGVIGGLTLRGGKVSVVFGNINHGCVDMRCGGSPPSESQPEQRSPFSLLLGGEAQKAPAKDQGLLQAPSPMPQVTAAVESEATAKEKGERKKDGEVAETQAPNPVQPVRKNPFVLSTEDHLSTFAIDVDTASYTAARNYLKNGALPAPDTVRIEEFVNYFPYNYPNPGDETFGIYVDAAPAPWNTTPEQNTYLIRVGVHGKEIEASKRDPVILTFVIDVSGSMNEPRRLPLVKESLKLLVKNLQEIDQVGIVSYGDTAQVVLQPTGLAERAKIIQAIEGLVNDGSTNAEEGLRLGYEMASRFAKKGVTNRVILCSDGVANVGASRPEEILKRVSDYAGQGIYLTTVGFGMGDFNDYLMEQLADKGNGNYAYVDTLAAARKVFERDLTGTLQVIAKDVKIQVDFNPAIVEQYRLLGYENRAVADVDFRNDKVDAGEVGAGHTVTALYEVVLASVEAGKALTVQLRYQDPKTGEVKEIAQPFNRESLRLKFEDTSPQFQLAVAAAGFAGYLRDGKPSLAEVQAVTRRMAPQWKENGETLEFIDLVEKAKQRP
jgi:Ca-activated chloride channel family protein